MRQARWLTAIALLFVTPALLRDGMNIVTHTYALAADKLWHGISPYLPPFGEGDVYKYSPFFAMLYGPLSIAGSRLQAILWALVNASVFWLGVSRWFPVDKKSPAWIWIALLVCSMEMDGSMHYQQVNVFLIGLVLLALAEYRDGRFFGAGFLLTLATNFKIVPGLFLLPLAFPWRRGYVKGVAAGAALAVLAPMLVVGPAKDFAFHSQWLGILKADIGAPGLLDIESVLAYLGVSPGVSHAVRIAILVVSLPLIARASKLRWEYWIPFVSAVILLVSPRTESPTFVLIAPSYLFLTSAALRDAPFARRVELCLLAFAMFFITYSYNDLWPKRLYNPLLLHFASKTLGVLGLWFLSGFLLITQGNRALSR